MHTKKSCVWCGIEVDGDDLWAVYADGMLVCECGKVVTDRLRHPEKPCIATEPQKGTKKCTYRKS